jgi:vancomycin resistance protein YoaR
MKKEFFLKTLPVVLLVIFLTFGVLVNALFLLNKNKISYGIRVANINLGGQTPENSKKILKNATDKWLKEKLELTLNDNILIIPWQSLGFSFDIDTTIASAIKIAKQNGFFSNVYNQTRALFGYYNVPIGIIWDKDTIDDFTKTHYSEYIKDSQNAQLIYKDGSLELITSASGREPNWLTFQRAVKEKANFIQPFEKYTIHLIHQYPEIKDDEVSLAKSKGEEILRITPYTIHFENKSWSLEKNLIGSWFNFLPAYDNMNSQNKILSLDIDKSLIASYLLNIVPEVNRLPKNARLKVDTDGLLKIKEKAITGIELLIEESAEEIRKNILEEKPTIGLLTNDTFAKVRLDNLDNIGINSLISRGESDFSGSSASRVNNIDVGSSKFDGYIIKPDEEFSFVGILGEITEKEGYLPGLVIKDNQLIPEYGGGICQVSTTMFRSAIYAGLKITERYPHSFPVSYYNPQGFDATIYPPHPDLRFINNTGGYIYIQKEVNDGKLAFEMYGKKNDKTIEVNGPHVYSRNEEDDSFRTVLWQEIYNKDGEQLEKNGFWSHYQSPSLFPIATTTPEEALTPDTSN